MSKKYSMFIGRWQPLHKGHLWLINQRLQEEAHTKNNKLENYRYIRYYDSFMDYYR